MGSYNNTLHSVHTAGQAECSGAPPMRDLAPAPAHASAGFTPRVWLIHTTVKEAVRELTRCHLQRAVIRPGLNADSRVKLFNNLASIKMRKINRVKMHIIFLDVDKQLGASVCFCLQPFMFMCEIKNTVILEEAGWRLSKRLSGLRWC